MGNHNSRQESINDYNDPSATNTNTDSGRKTDSSKGRRRRIHLFQGKDYDKAGSIRSIDKASFALQSKKLEDQPYFHGRLPREELVDILKDHGDFVVRESVNTRTEQPIVLSVLWGQSQRHFPITHDIKKMKWHLGEHLFWTVPELILHYYKNKKGIGKDDVQLLNPVPKDKYQLMNEQVELVTRLGTGNFGEVWKGKLTKTCEGDKGAKVQWVAIKVCKDSEEITNEQKKKFLAEARIMKRYQHPNVLALIGICITRDPIMIVTELMAGGLDDFLKKNRGTIAVTELTKFCVDAASGMAYLSKRNCIHRDLAARNCLLDDKNNLKISDFGLSREGSNYTIKATVKDAAATGSSGKDLSNQQLPIRWLAPEAITYWQFSSKSDVWSFGVLMYEIFTEGAVPYAELENHEIPKAILEDGVRLKAPPRMPNRLGVIMKYCLEGLPENRPGFKELKEKIGEEHNRLTGTTVGGASTISSSTAITKTSTVIPKTE